ncbi:MAG: preprotein translocase subunit SecY, partial [Gammaproteobacteria bacterium]|nr:preprotein translocase subunit SecY [Gammaproteobacteria bacterium]
MAVARSALAGALSGIGGLAELKRRLLFVLLALVVFRIGAHIPVPGIDPVVLATLFEQQRGTIVDMFNMFSGGALQRLSLFALGIMPYISASIIVQLLSSVVPTLEQLKKEGESGRRKITQYTRRGTLVLALFQAVGIAIALQSQSAGGAPLVPNPGYTFIFTATSR